MHASRVLVPDLCQGQLDDSRINRWSALSGGSGVSSSRFRSFDSVATGISAWQEQQPFSLKALQSRVAHNHLHIHQSLLSTTSSLRHPARTLSAAPATMHHQHRVSQTSLFGLSNQVPAPVV